MRACVRAYDCAILGREDFWSRSTPLDWMWVWRLMRVEDEMDSYFFWNVGGVDCVLEVFRMETRECYASCYGLWEIRMHLRCRLTNDHLLDANGSK
jgi:hypothetical protein